MARRILDERSIAAHVADQARARALNDAMSKAIERKSAPRAKPPKMLAEEVRAMRRASDWSCATPSHFVELYCWCHEQVYGVPAAELVRGAAAKKARLGAISAARRMLETEFDSPAAMAAFLGWAWRREEQREEWRKANGREGGRLTWAILFAGRSVLTDYRTSKLRARA